MIDTSFNKIIELIEIRKNSTKKKVNEEMILLYLDVGKYLFELQQDSNYGDKITTKADGTEYKYEDNQGFWKIATLEEVRKNDYNLNPASYVGVIPMEQPVGSFEEKMKALTEELYKIRIESKELDNIVEEELKLLGWNI